jgi:hypothetical protein
MRAANGTVFRKQSAMTEWADFCVYWTARTALAFYVLSLGLRMLAAGRPSWLNAARLTWTIGYGIFLVHLAAAFHFVHGWSHAAAIEETARRTHETVGLDWGGGVYVNHTFAIVCNVFAAPALDRGERPGVSRVHRVQFDGNFWPRRDSLGRLGSRAGVAGRLRSPDAQWAQRSE